MKSTVHSVETSHDLELCVARNLARRGMGEIMSRYFARLICSGSSGLQTASMQFSLLASESLGDAENELHNRSVYDQIFRNLKKAA